MYRVFEQEAEKCVKIQKKKRNKMFIAFYHSGRNYIYGLYIFINCVIRSTVINLREPRDEKS